MNKQVSHWRKLALGLIVTTCAPFMAAHGQSATRSQDYLRDVVSLSEALGKAHAVRATCNGTNDQYWRGYMQRLLELEAPYQSGLRDSMVNGFNAGFSVGTAMHPVCDGSAIAAEKNYASVGRVLTAKLVAGNMPSTAD